MESPRVVVGIPTHNDSASIDKTLSYLAAQTYSPDLIVFCDNSDDSTRNIIQENSSEFRPSIKIINQQSDGVAGAYNEILSYIEGQYDIFITIQSDLKFNDSWIENHVNLHMNNPELDMVNGPYKHADRKEGFMEPDDKSYYLGRNFSVKKGVLEEIDGWDENFLRGEDWDMRIRLAGADTTVYSTTDVGYDWQREDPYITFSKAKRRPTVATFLAKYGRWYLWFHPSHVVSDGLSVAAVVFGVLGLGGLLISPFLSALSLSAMLIMVGLYTVLHNLLRGGVDGKRFVGPIRKQFLNGLAVLYAVRRIMDSDTEWNMSGFDPDNIPRYKF